MDDYVGKCKEAIELSKKALPKVVDPSLKNLPSQIPFRVVCLRDILIHRVTHLADQAIEIHAANQFLPLMMTVRAAMETGALLYLLDKKIAAAIESEDTKELEVFLKKATIGSRNSDTEIDAVNILTALDHMSKKFPPVRKYYDNLSEFCHPNFAGVLASYSRLSEDKTRLELGPDLSPPLHYFGPPLSVTLVLANEYFNRTREKDDELYRVCGCA